MQQLYTFFFHIWENILRTFFLFRSYSDMIYFHVWKKTGFVRLCCAGETPMVASCTDLQYNVEQIVVHLYVL